MTHVGRYIKLIYMISLIFISFSSNLVAEDIIKKEASELDSYTLTDKDISIITSIVMGMDWNSFKKAYPELLPLSITNTISRVITKNYYQELKNNNFRDYTIKERIMFIYLSSILDRILEANRDVLSSYGKKPEDIRILLEKAIAVNEIGMDIKQNPDGVFDITLRLNSTLGLLTEPFTFNDAYLSAAFSHELAHLLIGHPFFKPLSIQIRQKEEIDADNLGFSLYLNAGFSAQYYKNIKIDIDPMNTIFQFPQEWWAYIRTRLPIIQSESRSSIKLHESLVELANEIFRTLNWDDISKIVEKNKYLNPTDVHPRPIWRFWNLYNQEQIRRQNKDIRVLNNTALTVSYFKIDLSNYEKLDELQKAFLSEDFSRLEIKDNNINDPRVQIINALLDDNSNIEFTLEQDTVDEANIGYLRKDNTIILKANDVFYITALSFAKENPCIFLFKPKLPYPNFSVVKEIIEKFMQQYRSN